MKKFFSILLIGCLSMLFAEIYSGASQTWFMNPFWILITYPLYLFHVLFFLWLALNIKKISLPQLYYLGVLFALYESWITKVLWVGYVDTNGPWMGTFLWVGILEFLVLVWFWHPIMSFIIPVLVFEIFSGKILSLHQEILTKSKKKTILIILFCILLSEFILHGNQGNIISANLSFLGTWGLIGITYFLWKKQSIDIFQFKKRGAIFISVYLLLLYGITFFFLLPQRIPHTLMPYVSILACYIIAIFLIYKSNPVEIKLLDSEEKLYTRKDIMIFSCVTFVSINILWNFLFVKNILMILTYLVIALIGTALLFTMGYKNLRKPEHKEINP